MLKFFSATAGPTSTSSGEVVELSMPGEVEDYRTLLPNLLLPWIHLLFTVDVVAFVGSIYLSTHQHAGQHRYSS